MKSLIKPAILAALMATASLAAFSQAPGQGHCDDMMGASGPMHQGMRHALMGRMNPQRMQHWIEKRNAALKAHLKITSEQESAWTAYTDALKPPAAMIGKQAEMAEIAKLPTPERIDKMKALHTQHVSDMTAAMDKRGAAVKALYAALTPEQQKVFDSRALHHPGVKMHHRRGGAGPDAPKPAQ
jgi:Spy/CpxP family protein refolding chaperone